MKVSASMELLIQFATYEATASQFREIEPEHLLMGILKLVELPIEDAEKLAPGAAVVKHLTAEIDAVRGELARRAVESTRVRRDLRVRMGKGGSPYSEGRIHRSTASRKIFGDAEKLAKAVGNETLSAKHLLEALLLSPTTLIKQALGHAVGAKESEGRETPLLDEHGKDLTRLAAEGKLPSTRDRVAECKALIDILRQPGRRSVLLVGHSELTIESVVFASAHAIAQEDGGSDLKKKRIIDVRSVGHSSEWNEQAKELAAKLFAEAASTEDVILFVPPIEQAVRGAVIDTWPGFLQKILNKGLIQLICCVSPTAYQKCIKRDSAWRRLVNIMWIQDEIGDEVPSEL